MYINDGKTVKEEEEAEKLRSMTDNERRKLNTQHRGGDFSSSVCFIRVRNTRRRSWIVEEEEGMLCRILQNALIENVCLES